MKTAKDYIQARLHWLRVEHLDQTTFLVESEWILGLEIFPPVTKSIVAKIQPV
jgi:hypothetical protein